ncbi:MAG TPA: glutathione S-transferase family protein [Polyangia bacterium]|nr:glutathione S-transferase family protein [Polyangia bacterium]
MGIRLYGWPNSTSGRVRWALKELGVSYERIELDREKGENRAPEYLAINPTGKVPGLVDDGQAYFESAAIILHLGETYGRERGLWPAAGPARAEALCWTIWSATELQAYMMQWLYHGLDTPVSYAPADRSRATAEYNHGQFLRNLDALDARLARREHLLGAGFSLADIPAASTLQTGLDLGASLEGRKHVAAWVDRCRNRPTFRR